VHGADDLSLVVCVPDLPSSDDYSGGPLLYIYPLPFVASTESIDEISDSHKQKENMP